jgi:PTS hybrid protein
VVSGSWVLPNDMGLHARPAAVLAQGLADLDAEVTVNGIDGKSVMLLMSLGLGKGKSVNAEASGPDAAAAIELIGTAVQAGFGELT